MEMKKYVLKFWLHSLSMHGQKGRGKKTKDIKGVVDCEFTFLTLACNVAV